MTRQGPTELDRAVWQHYLSHWGEPQDSVRFDQRTRHPSLRSRSDLPELVDVMIFAAQNDDGERYWQFATIGMANLAMAGGRRVELELTCREPLSSDERQHLAKLLANLSLYPFIHGETLDWGAVVPDIEGLRKVSTMRAAMLQRPHFEEPSFATVESSGVRIAWVVPLHDDEYALAASQSPQVLEQRLEAAETDVLDLRRPSSL